MCPKDIPIVKERAPNPPLGYSCECNLSRDKQIHIVALFHAHKIRPSRIAYRVGIDIALIEALVSGEEEPRLFSRLVAHCQKNRFKQQLNQAGLLSGSARFESQQLAEKEYIDDSKSEEIPNSI